MHVHCSELPAELHQRKVVQPPRLSPGLKVQSWQSTPPGWQIVQRTLFEQLFLNVPVKYLAVPPHPAVIGVMLPPRQPFAGWQVAPPPLDEPPLDDPPLEDPPPDEPEGAPHWDVRQVLVSALHERPFAKHVAQPLGRHRLPWPVLVQVAPLGHCALLEQEPPHEARDPEAPLDEPPPDAPLDEPPPDDPRPLEPLE